MVDLFVKALHKSSKPTRRNFILLPVHLEEQGFISSLHSREIRIFSSGKELLNPGLMHCGFPRLVPDITDVSGPFG